MSTQPSIEVTPDASAVLEELNRLVRLGQTNFHFANIWEHRSTRKEIVSGFSDLKDAISNIDSAVDTSFYNLERSINDDISSSVIELIKIRESIDKNTEDLNKKRLK